MSHLTPNEQRVLRLMNRLISQGWEYPEAEWAVSRETGFSCSAIRELYDSQFD
jgi:hypothetical protein